MNTFKNCKVEVPDEGSATFDGELPDGQISFKRDGDVILISSGGKSLKARIRYYDEPEVKPKREFVQ